MKAREIMRANAIEMADKMTFLLWLHQESCPVPRDAEEAEVVVRRWMRNRQMAARRTAKVVKAVAAL